MGKCGREWSREWAMVLELLKNSIWTEIGMMKKRQLHEDLRESIWSRRNPRYESQKASKSTYDVFEGRKEELRSESLVSSRSCKDLVYVRDNNPW